MDGACSGVGKEEECRRRNLDKRRRIRNELERPMQRHRTNPGARKRTRSTRTSLREADERNDDELGSKHQEATNRAPERGGDTPVVARRSQCSIRCDISHHRHSTPTLLACSATASLPNATRCGIAVILSSGTRTLHHPSSVPGSTLALAAASVFAVVEAIAFASNSGCDTARLLSESRFLACPASRSDRSKSAAPASVPSPPPRPSPTYPPPAPLQEPTIVRMKLPQHRRFDQPTDTEQHIIA